MPYTVLYAGEESVNYPTDIFTASGLVEISGHDWFIIGRFEDGTAQAAIPEWWNDDYTPIDVSAWTGLKQVAGAVDGYHAVGLKTDGTCLATGVNDSGQGNVSTWSGVTQIAVGGYFTVGLKSDGTCVATGDNTYGQCNVSGWTDIVAISAESDDVIGLKSDGTCVAAGRNYFGQGNVGTWSDIEAITMGQRHSVGLKSDGTCVKVGGNFSNAVTSWTGITAIKASKYQTIGLKSDGTVLTTWTSEEVAAWTSVADAFIAESVVVGLQSAGTPHEYEGGCLLPFSASGVLSKRIITPRSVTGRLRLWSPDRLTLFMETTAFNSLQIIRRFVGNCTLEAYFPAFSDEAYYVHEGSWIEDDEGEWYRIHYRRGTKDNVQVIAYGPHKLLSQRITVPASGQYAITSTGSADQIVKAFITASLRGLPISCASVRTGGASISEVSRYKNLGDEVARICYAYDIGESFAISGTDFIFDTYEGTDRTRGNTADNAPAVFSIRYDNLEDWSHAISSTDEVTTVYVAGQGTGTTRTIVIVGNTATGEERFELFRDARDTNTTSILASRGAESVFPPAESFSAKANTSSNLTYNTDYALGDLVTIEIPERTAIYDSATGLWEKVERYRSEDKRITEIVRTYEGGAMDIDLVFGEAPKTRGDKQSEVQSNLSRLEAI